FGPPPHQGGPPHHGGHRPHHPPLPPFFANLTDEAFKQFFRIVKDRNLTKAERESKLRKWAADQGEEFAEKQFVFQKQFDKMRKGHEELEAKVQKLAKEILQNVTDLITQISDIKNNTQLKMDEEKEQIRSLLYSYPRPLVKIMKLAIHAAIKSTVSFQPQEPLSTKPFPTVTDFTTMF
ncbi:unnamed protein product, partial [Enterobius vermicularis]|uniref:DUF148 domain-containing protein n=1 Tax=Enterobius vermicularis TaxID=51028 RepID=A0A0N4VM24_ENTVE